ncbi:unnamed protein product [Protopolystoma xenopodis]|uniref:Uncharacterized protein n=1 Tax=Protopolystoma xenopodis TaxID=117903 RepID=A0A3S4ZYG7_9PLAT|nr:unnamed protein product [Protopolystoma xenopodis]
MSLSRLEWTAASTSHWSFQHPKLESNHGMQCDLFAEKILKGHTKLETYFPAFTHYSLPCTEKRETLTSLGAGADHPKGLVKKALCTKSPLMRNLFSCASSGPEAGKKDSNSDISHCSSDNSVGFRPAADCTDVGDKKLLLRAKCFIRDQFLVRAMKNYDTGRRCYAHYTTAVDTGNIKRVFSDCQNMLQRAYMMKIGLM